MIEKAQYPAYFSSFYRYINLQHIGMYGNRCGNAQTGTVTNFWVRKAMVGCQMFYDTKITELESPERAFLTFFMQSSVKWA